MKDTLHGNEPWDSIDGVLYDVKAGVMTVLEASKEIKGYFPKVDTTSTIDTLHGCCDGECNHDDCCGKIPENCPLYHPSVEPAKSSVKCEHGERCGTCHESSDYHEPAKSDGGWGKRLGDIYAKSNFDLYGQLKEFIEAELTRAEQKRTEEIIGKLKPVEDALLYISTRNELHNAVCVPRAIDAVKTITHLKSDYGI